MSTAGMNDADQYLTFRLDNETYGLGIKKVREVLESTAITRVPRMPEFMRGIINLRGGVLPVVDLRLKLGMTKTENSEDTCIIIIELMMDDEITLVGALADSVKEVISMEENEIVPPPRLGTSLNTEFIMGMGKKNDEFIIIIDIDRVFSFKEVADLKLSDDEHLLQNSTDKTPVETDLLREHL